jgi:hypothetical protein
MAKKIKKPKVNEIDENQIKYFISNTPIPVIITLDEQVLFKTTDEILKDLNSKNPETISKHKKDVEKSLEYLILEGFVEE